MASFTLSFPEGVLKRMRKHSEVRWSEIAREAVIQQLDEWERAEKIASKSRLTEKDVEELAAAVDRDMARHFKVR